MCLKWTVAKLLSLTKIGNTLLLYCLYFFCLITIYFQKMALKLRYFKICLSLIFYSPTWPLKIVLKTIWNSAAKEDDFSRWWHLSCPCGEVLLLLNVSVFFCALSSLIIQLKILANIFVNIVSFHSYSIFFTVNS